MRRRGILGPKAKRPKISFEDHEERNAALHSEELSRDDAVPEHENVDSLDCFMDRIRGIVDEENKAIQRGEQVRIARDVDELKELDPLEVYLESVENQARQEIANSADSTEMVDERNDGISGDECKKSVPLIPPLDFARIPMMPFKRDLYKQHPEVANLSKEKVQEIRKEMEIKVNGIEIPNPCVSFAHFQLVEALLRAISKAGFETPTPIQSQAIPIILKGRDLIGIAKTGSGKTGSYIWPMLMHVSEKLKSESNSTHKPQAIILAPTRELADQIFLETKRFSKSIKEINVAPVYGGMNLHEQELLLTGTKNRTPLCDVLVGTPGRLIDHIKRGNVKLDDVSFVVLDEADRMLDLGFESQIRSILGQIRPDRQLAMFSATFARRVQALANTFLKSPIRVHAGEEGALNSDILQHFIVENDENDKWNWLASNIHNMVKQGRILIFVSTKHGCEELSRRLKQENVENDVLHGDKLQHERMQIIDRFKKKKTFVLIATDVAARGLDIKELDFVVNYEVAKDLDTHTHRIGRTGRAGRGGEAYTLLSKQKPCKFIPTLIKRLQESGAFISEELWQMAKVVDPSIKIPVHSKFPSFASKTSDFDTHNTYPVFQKTFPQAKKTMDKSSYSVSGLSKSEVFSSFQKSFVRSSEEPEQSAAPASSSRWDA